MKDVYHLSHSHCCITKYVHLINDMNCAYIICKFNVTKTNITTSLKNPIFSSNIIRVSPARYLLTRLQHQHLVYRYLHILVFFIQSCGRERFHNPKYTVFSAHTTLTRSPGLDLVYSTKKVEYKRKNHSSYLEWKF